VPAGTPAALQRSPVITALGKRNMEQAFSELSTDTWQALLPSDWSHEEKNGQLYFESVCGSKGFYIATWNLGANECNGDSVSVAKQFRKIEIEDLNDMKNKWAVLEDQIISSDGCIVFMHDAFDSDSNYRIISTVLVSHPIAVRASFHDYLCENIEESNQIAKVVSDSVRLKSNA
jgi:hypothetical protein